MVLPVARLIPALVIAVLPINARALVIRSYESSRHDRFVTGGSGLEINTAAYYNLSNPSGYTGVGYGNIGSDVRQYALVTPKHLLFAGHNRRPLGTAVNFLNSDGEITTRKFVAFTSVPNPGNETVFSDIVILHLETPIEASREISPLPYLNLVNEVAYAGSVFTTFGQNLRGGRGTIAFFDDFISGNSNTRTYRFFYGSVGSGDDAHVSNGDSGSPTLVTVNGEPALVGIHLASSEDGSTNIDTFVPHYASTINELLAPEGYQLIPAYPAAVTLSADTAHDPLRQAFPGSVDINFSNANAATATNVRLNLTFPAEAIPDSISGSGWIVENPSPGQYSLRTATIDGNTSSTLTASYTSIPVVTEISIEALHRSDGSPELGETFNLSVQPTFAGYVADLPLKGETDDPDFDGFTNLIEYAFGGNPGAASSVASEGHLLSPATLLESGGISYSFPMRTDAAERGLEYEIEFSGSLQEMSWSTTPPPGFAMNTAPYDPDSPGFEMVTATFPAGSPDKNFLRVKVTLTE